jgi:hypothetical protein
VEVLHLRQGSEAAMYLPAIADGENPHDQLTILDRVDDAVVPDSQPPPRVVALKGLDVEGRGITGLHRLLKLGKAMEDPHCTSCT